MPRRRFTERDVLLTLLEQGAEIPCGICRGPILYSHVWQKLVQRDHNIPVALGGEDTPGNCRYVHDACHAHKTSGGPATTAGSDINHITKVRRRERPAKPKKKIPGRPMQKPSDGISYDWERGRYVHSEEGKG